MCLSHRELRFGLIALGSIALTLVACRGNSQPQSREERNQYRLEGRIAAGESPTVTLYRDGLFVGFTYDDGSTVEVLDGRFAFVGRIDAPEVVHLEAEGKPKLPVFVETGTIEVDLDLSGPGELEVSGSAAHALFARFRARHADYLDRIERASEELEAARASGDAAAEVVWEELGNRARQAEAAFLDNWIASHADTVVAPYVAVRHRIGVLDLARLEPLLDLFPAKLARSRYVRELERRRELLAAAGVGETVPAFELPTARGDVVSIEEFRGRFTLIDFWGAWCGPCRAQNPDLVELYRAFDRDDFDILGVSIDFSRQAWIEAIEADGLPWTQMGDVSGFDTEPARLFAVRSLPANVLLGRDGTILAKDVEIDELPGVVASLVGRR